MKQHSLQTTGLSLSQAQSISNLCNQRAKDIDAKLSNINNYSKTVTVGDKELVILNANKLPENVIDLLKEKAALHATQAFLMENIKAKDTLIKNAKNEIADISAIKKPEIPTLVKPTNLPQVDEDWGWERLTISEICTYQEAEAYAAHIGQFIHQGKTLDVLRKELPTIDPIEWMVIKDGEKTPVMVNLHHTSEELLSIHEELAALHRNYESTVNFFKAKVKNLVTIENARIAKLNSDAQHDAQKTNNILNSEYQTKYNAFNEELRSVLSDFENTRQENIKKIASLRINVDKRFQKVVDLFLNDLPAE